MAMARSCKGARLASGGEHVGNSGGRAAISRVHGAFPVVDGAFSRVHGTFPVVHGTFSRVHATPSVVNGAFSRVHATLPVAHGAFSPVHTAFEITQRRTARNQVGVGIARAGAAPGTGATPFPGRCARDDAYT